MQPQVFTASSLSQQKRALPLTPHSGPAPPPSWSLGPAGIRVYHVGEEQVRRAALKSGFPGYNGVIKKIAVTMVTPSVPVCHQPRTRELGKVQTIIGVDEMITRELYSLLVTYKHFHLLVINMIFLILSW